LAELKGLEPKVRKVHWYKNKYHGKIYCPTVSSGIILVRRNGIYHWSGNTTKGYSRLTDLGELLRKKSGVAKMEAGNSMKWMVNESMIPVGAEGNPTKNWPSAMILVERLQPCVIHRRQIDFADITFLGKYLRGRFYIRLVQRKLQEEEKPKYAQGKEMKNWEVFMWKAKEQFDEKGMEAVASGDLRMAPTAAPASHDKKVTETGELL
jgi:hypothetical protein